MTLPSHLATSPRFKDNAQAALADPDLQNALGFVEVNFIARRREVASRLPEFEALRDSARDIKNHTLANLDLYLEAYEERLTAQGGHVHYAATAEEARRIILDICRGLGAKTVTKGKSMIAEEIGLNDFLEGNGITPVETDLGEYIIQLRHEMPSHIIAPAVHLTKAQIEDDFRRVHTHLPADRNLVEPASLLAEARGVLREKFLAADVGITGANFLVAETGTSIIVTNEGNGDLTQTLPKVHIVLASIEKLVPTLEDADADSARAGALGDRAGDVGLYDALDRSAPRRRSRRPGRISRRPARQRPLGDARRRVPRHAALHPLRRLHEPLPGLSRDRRPCLWLGLSGADGRGADAEPDRHRQGRQSAQRLDLLRALRRSLPGAHSAAEHDALVARARVRAPSVAGDRAHRARVLGLLRQAAPALRLCDVDRGAAPRTWRRPRADGFPSCRSRRAGRGIAIFPRRRARRSSRGGRTARFLPASTVRHEPQA